MPRGRPRKVPRKEKSPWWDEERSLWEPPQPMTVSECADKYRILSNKSARPGKWETNFVAFNRQIMDCFAYDCIEEIWYVKPTQTGGTDGILNMILYAAIQDPSPAMIVEPNEGLADEISQERIDDMIRSCDKLQEQAAVRDDDSTKKKKVFNNMTLYLAWAGSPSSLASRPIRYVFFDEVNKYPAFSGQEASPIALGKERTNTFILNRKLIYVSTPTVENGYVTVGEKSADARFRYKIACPHCGEYQQLIFPQVKFGDEREPSKVEEVSWYECEKCQARIFDSDKAELIRRGKWFDLNSGLDFETCMAEQRPRRVGFQISRLYSPWHTFGMVGAEFIRAKDDPMNLMNWKNSWMAEEWIERIYHKSEDDILSHKNETPALVVPPGTVAVTGGIDPGQGGFWFLNLAWVFKNGIYDVHVVHYGFLTDWELVRQLFLEGAYQGEGGKAYPVWRAGLDTGGGEYGGGGVTMTEDSYNFLRRFGGNRIFGTKGVGQRSGKRMQVSVIDKMPKSNQPIPGGVTLWLIDTDSFKDVLHYRLQVKPTDPGGITFNAETQPDIAKHILAEEKRKNRKGETEWVQASSMNHLLDCLCLALAMGDSECWGGVRVLSKEQAIKTDNKTPEPKEIMPDPIESIIARTMPKGNRIISKNNWMGSMKGWIK